MNEVGIDGVGIEPGWTELDGVSIIAVGGRVVSASSRAMSTRLGRDAMLSCASGCSWIAVASNDGRGVMSTGGDAIPSFAT